MHQNIALLRNKIPIISGIRALPRVGRGTPHTHIPSYIPRRLRRLVFACMPDPASIRSFTVIRLNLIISMESLFDFAHHWHKVLSAHETKMATLMRSMCKLGYNVSRLSHFRRLPVKAKIAQPTCSIFTSNKKKDAATHPVSEKEGNEVERLDNLLEKDEVCWPFYHVWWYTHS